MTISVIYRCVKWIDSLFVTLPLPVTALLTIW